MTYPIPSAKYDEFVCTAGVTEGGDFIRLFPINYRDLPKVQQYKKYQWIEVRVKRDRRDGRKESCRPIVESIRLLGEPLGTKDGWREIAKCVLKKKVKSMEELWSLKDIDETSLGIFRPKNVENIVIAPDEPEWKPKYLNALKQMRLWETRRASLIPLRKVPFLFHFRFCCDDERCNGHKMSIHDWEVGDLFWSCVDGGDSQRDAAEKVKNKFLSDICDRKKVTYFYVGTMKKYGNWIVLGAFYPKVNPQLTLL